mmetsp:Transcript_43523/g.123160  ORF Transcript_43523/g.123160 Transcript_43523/m.123160 type:complete len:416 (+) Transcript_43523:69-1316(+)|eukprot:CAMPEP_0179361058 /NCGR_PEP_ID=MMETSP0797-20121207/80296_1 /TAXON_ID=47934 /ORGANISM="Dinophysis acuminata, Strain DAEP01" /LENGTH=415 /DNA_ID=CAMNT_0021076431 /DNA_START=56 /DNA_END=1303 /DNA_ORIENTATION=+
MSLLSQLEEAARFARLRLKKKARAARYAILLNNAHLGTKVECVVHHPETKQLVSHARRCANIVLACVIPCLVPLVEAFRSVGFRWAQQADVEFSTILPLFLGTLILGSAFLVMLLACHGVREFRQLADPGYLGFAVPGLFRTGMFVGANWALVEGSSATLLVMVMKSALLPGIFGEMWLTKKRPWITQLWTIAALMLSITIYTLSVSDADVSFSGTGLFYCVCAAQCDFVGGLSLEAGIRLRLKKKGVNQSAEKIRCQLVNEVWKAHFYMILGLVFELDFLKDGLVRGWNMQIVSGTVVTIPFYVAIYNYSCIAVGTLQTNIFSSVDIGVTCILEYMAFGDPITTISGLLILVTTLLILIYSTLVIDLRRHAQQVLRESRLDVSRRGTSDSDEDAHQSCPATGQKVSVFADVMDI